jgi:hypothetical protein
VRISFSKPLDDDALPRSLQHEALHCSNCGQCYKALRRDVQEVETGCGSIEWHPSEAKPEVMCVSTVSSAAENGVGGLFVWLLSSSTFNRELWMDWGWWRDVRRVRSVTSKASQLCDMLVATARPVSSEGAFSGPTHMGGSVKVVFLKSWVLAADTI